MLAYLRVIANPADEVSLTRIVNVAAARASATASIKQIAAYAVGNGISLLERDGARPPTSPGCPPGPSTAAKAFVELVRRWRRWPGSAPPHRGGGRARPRRRGDASTASPASRNCVRPGRAGGKVQALMEDVVRRSGLEQLLAKGDKANEEGERAIDNVNELITSAAEYDRDNPDGTLDEYLAQVSLVSDTDHMKGGGGAVTLMTLHAAKGLEFPVVAMIGLEEGVLPHSRARGQPRRAGRRAPALLRRHHPRPGAADPDQGRSTARSAACASGRSPARSSTRCPASSCDVTDRTGLDTLRRPGASSAATNATRATRAGRAVPQGPTRPPPDVRPGPDRGDHRHGPAHAGRRSSSTPPGERR